jgi:predicted DNA-binding helix-hairpin-helix protein
MGAMVEDKLVALSTAAEYDLCSDSCGPPVNRFAPSVTRLLLPNGGALAVLKVLMTDACQYRCYYCANRAERRGRRHSFRPEELVASFMDLHQRGLVNGLFLSSGVRGSAASTMQDMLTAVEALRERHQFRGYVHLKVLPGSPYDTVEKAVELADRVSVNMEAPTQKALDHLSSDKALAEDVIKRMHWIKQAAERGGGKLKAGQTTQFVVGVAGETDREILNTSEGLRRSVGLRRSYFSAFRPIADTPLAGEPPAPPMRQHRLYQADWLLRRYGFGMSEIAFDQQGGLPIGIDPKLAYALRRLHAYPVEVNRATRAELLRVPGIGLQSVARILAARESGRLTSFDDLRALGAVTRRAAPFLLVGGRREGSLSDLLRKHRVEMDQLALDFSPHSLAAVVVQSVGSGLSDEVDTAAGVWRAPLKGTAG